MTISVCPVRSRVAAPTTRPISTTRFVRLPAGKLSSLAKLTVGCEWGLRGSVCGDHPRVGTTGRAAMNPPAPIPVRSRVVGWSAAGRAGPITPGGSGFLPGQRARGPGKTSRPGVVVSKAKPRSRSAPGAEP